MKVDWGSTATVRSIYLVPREGSSAVNPVNIHLADDGIYYNLNGQRLRIHSHGSALGGQSPGMRVERPVHGVFIKNGKKIIVK